VPPEPSTTPPSSQRRRSLLAATLLSATWIACVIAVDGMLDLIVDLPVVRERDMGALYAPAIITFAAAVLFLRLFVGVRRGVRAAALLAVDALLLSYFAQVLAAAFGVAVVRRSIGEGLLAVVREAPAPSTVITAGIAAVCAVLFAWLAAREEADAERTPPWDGGHPVP
jgi:Family of unknown function (DUF6121)